MYCFNQRGAGQTKNFQWRRGKSLVLAFTLFRTNCIKRKNHVQLCISSAKTLHLQGEARFKNQHGNSVSGFLFYIKFWQYSIAVRR